MGVGARHSHHHFSTYPLPINVEGTVANSLQNALLEVNATARYGASHVKIEAEVDKINGFFTVWLSGDVSRGLFGMLLSKIKNNRLRQQLSVLHGAEFKECLALQTKIDKNFMEKMVEHTKVRLEYVVEHAHYSPCSVDGVKGRWINQMCSRGDYTIMGAQAGPVFLKFSQHHKWFGPLAPRPRCANVVRDARLAAPALQFMTEALPDSEFKTDAQQLIAHMSEGEQPRYGVRKMPVFVVMLAGISVISVIAGFAIGQRS